MLFYFVNSNGNVIETHTLEDIAKLGSDLKETIKNLIKEIPNCVDCLVF